MPNLDPKLELEMDSQAPLDMRILAFLTRMEEKGGPQTTGFTIRNLTAELRVPHEELVSTALKTLKKGGYITTRSIESLRPKSDRIYLMGTGKEALVSFLKETKPEPVIEAKESTTFTIPASIPVKIHPQDAEMFPLVVLNEINLAETAPTAAQIQESLQAKFGLTQGPDEYDAALSQLQDERLIVGGKTKGMDTTRSYSVTKRGQDLLKEKGLSDKRIEQLWEDIELLIGQGLLVDKGDNHYAIAGKDAEQAAQKAFRITAAFGHIANMTESPQLHAELNEVSDALAGERKWALDHPRNGDKKPRTR